MAADKFIVVYVTGALGGMALIVSIIYYCIRTCTATKRRPRLVQDSSHDYHHYHQHHHESDDKRPLDPFMLMGKFKETKRKQDGQQ